MSCPLGFTSETAAPISFTHPITVDSVVAETIKPGDRYCLYGEDIIWTEHHLRPSRLAPLRGVGDDLSDLAFVVLKIQRDDNVYDALMDYVSRPEREQESLAPRMLLDEMMRVPEWVDWDRVHHGQRVFWKYLPTITAATIYSSVVYSFALPGMSRVISSTGYAIGPKILDRLVETNQFLFDISYAPENLIPGKGVGWKAILHVRRLHSQVRTRLHRLGKAHPKYYDIEKLGVAINQEDMLMTLVSLSSLIWDIMERRLGVTMSTQEKEGYLHLWRYTGYLMGASEETLALMATTQKADATLESLKMHLVHHNTTTGKSTATMVRNLAAKPIISRPIETIGGILDPFTSHMALIECVTTREVWAALGFESASWMYRMLRQLPMKGMVLDNWMASLFVPWRVTRNYLMLLWHNDLFERMNLERKTKLSIQSDAENAERLGMSKWSIRPFVQLIVIILVFLISSSFR